MLIGILISNIIIVLGVQKVGKKFIMAFINKKQLKKAQKFLGDTTNNAKTEAILVILFAMPGTPKDLITYLGATLPIEPKRYIIISTFARIPTIITSTIAGNNILSGNWTFIAIIYIITFGVSGISLYLLNKKGRGKFE